MVCPRLVWAGPTRQNFFDFHQKNHKGPVEWHVREAEIGRRLHKPLNRSDRALLTYLRKLGVLRDEPILRQELESMEKGLGVSLLVVVPQRY